MINAIDKKKRYSYATICLINQSYLKSEANSNDGIVQWAMEMSLAKAGVYHGLKHLNVVGTRYMWAVKPNTQSLYHME